jgi:hypothetical protein
LFTFITFHHNTFTSLDSSYILRGMMSEQRERIIVLI